MLSTTMVNKSPLRLTAFLSLTALLLAGCAQNGSEIMAKASAEPFAAATPEAVSIVTEKVFPAVVRIDVAQEVYRQGRRNLQRAIGSGFIIDKEGHILTNFHVAGRAAELYVTLANKERVPAKLIGDDHWSDIAVIQLDMDEIKKRKISFTWAELGDSSKLVIGEPVIAIGTPFGLTRTMTLGIVSNNERTFYPGAEMIDGEYETGEFNNWIQMDTPIAPGSSGGPLVNMHGKIVGVNTRGYEGEALNFAIPINTVKTVSAEILRTAKPDEKGRVDRSDLGLDLKPLQDLESFYEIDVNKGVLINSVEKGSSAMAAGVKTQDILLEINGKPVNVRFPEEVSPTRKIVADLPLGQDVALTVRRGKETIHLTAKTQKLEGAIGAERELKAWGLSVRDVTRKYANEAQLDDDSGVVVTTMSSGYPAAKAELRAGDVIRSINDKPAGDLEAFMKIYNESLTNKASPILLEVQRGRGRRNFVLNITY